MTLFWTAHKLYRKVKPAQGREGSPGLVRGPHILTGVVAGLLTNMLLSLVDSLLLGDSIGITLRRVVAVVVLSIAVAVGVQVYRLLRRRVVEKELDN